VHAKCYSEVSSGGINVKLKMDNKRIFLLALIMILLIALVIVMRYIFITKPLKDELVSKAFDYIILESTAWVIPEQYRSNPGAMPETEIQAMRDQAMDIINHYLLPGTITEWRAIETYNDLIDDQLKGDLFIIKQELYMGNIIKARIKSDKAEFVFNVNWIEDSVEERWGRMERDLWSEYSVQFVKLQGEWKIRILNSRPTDPPEEMSLAR
jgi:hypothetical protein